jgi:hypothetical protein
MTSGVSPTPSVIQQALLQAAALPTATLDATSVIGVLTPDATQPYGSMLVGALSGAPTVNTITAITAQTLTLTASATNLYENFTGTLTGAQTLTLPTVAVLVAALGSAFYVGMSWRVRIINASPGAFAWTLTTATGWGTVTNGAVAQNTYRDFILTLTSATAGTVVSVGSGVSP